MLRLRAARSIKKRKNARPLIGTINSTNDDGSGTADIAVPVRTILSTKKSHPLMFALGVVMQRLVNGTVNEVKVTVVNPEADADARGPIGNGSRIIPSAIPNTMYLSEKGCPLNNRKLTDVNRNAVVGKSRVIVRNSDGSPKSAVPYKLDQHLRFAFLVRHKSEQNRRRANSP